MISAVNISQYNLVSDCDPRRDRTTFKNDCFDRNMK